MSMDLCGRCCKRGASRDDGLCDVCRVSLTETSSGPSGERAIKTSEINGTQYRAGKEAKECGVPRSHIPCRDGGRMENSWLVGWDDGVDLQEALATVTAERDRYKRAVEAVQGSLEVQFRSLSLDESRGDQNRRMRVASALTSALKEPGDATEYTEHTVR